MLDGGDLAAAHVRRPKSNARRYSPSRNRYLKEVIDSEEAAPADKALVPFDPVQRYLAEIRRFPLLSREEEHRLAVDYKQYGNVKRLTSWLRRIFVWL